MNVLVFPIIIGYAIQNGIYIYYRFLEEVDVAHSLVKVGPAVIASTLTTLVGWSVLLIAEHRGLHSIGLVACIGISISLLIALTPLPSILEKYFKKPIAAPIPDIEILPEPVSQNLPQPQETIESRFVEEFLEFQEANSLDPPVIEKPKVTKKKFQAPTSKKTIAKKKKNVKKNS